MNKNYGWFEVNKEGLAKLLEKRGKSFAIFELIQNAWDTDARSVTITLTPVKEKGRKLARIIIKDDDPKGFANLAHAFTLFDESCKKNDPTKRGRFNLGEKLVLALCDSAEIASMKGTVTFTVTKSGEYKRTFDETCKTQVGSYFSGLLRLNSEEYADVCAKVRTLIPPKNVTTTFNGEELLYRKPVCTFDVQLPTESSDEEGILRKTQRYTTVSVYEARGDETAAIYEMGIPIVETGDKFHVDISQKVPLNMDRDNVPPAYLRLVRTLVLNNTFDKIEPDDANSTWVREGASDKRCSEDAIKRVLDHRFGEKRVSYDPSDPEANKRAMAAGYTVIPGRALSLGEWENTRNAGGALPAGQVTPTPKPFSEDGSPLKMLSEEKYTKGIQDIIRYAKLIASQVLGTGVTVEIANDIGWHFVGAYTRSSKFTGTLILNVAKLGYSWFDNGASEAVTELLIHEFGHHYSSDHLSEDYHDALCRIGAGIVNLALKQPKFLLVLDSIPR